MAHRVDFDGDHLRVWDESDNLVWADNIKPINLLPDEFTINATIDMVFPNMVTSFNHVRSLVHSTLLDMDLVACTSWGIIQTNLEWGPDESAPYTLSDQILGTVPFGVNYLDVRVGLIRTVSPGSYLNVAIDNELPEEETFLPGGSMRLEDTPSWRRSAWIGLSGTNVVLKKWQSVGTGGIIAEISDTRTPGGSGWYSPVNSGTWVLGSLQAQQTEHVWTNNGNSSRYVDGHCLPGTIPTWGARWQGYATIRPGFIPS